MSTNAIIMMVLMILCNWGAAALVITKIVKSKDKDFTTSEKDGIGV